jgi:hypothetical protein
MEEIAFAKPWNAPQTRIFEFWCLAEWRQAQRIDLPLLTHSDWSASAADGTTSAPCLGVAYICFQTSR